MRILFVGDVMGNVGQTAVTTYLPKLKRRYKHKLLLLMGKMPPAAAALIRKCIRTS